MNPILLRSLGLAPKQAMPGALLEHELLFAGAPQARATFWPAKGASTAGVLYKFSEAQLPRLAQLNEPATAQAAQARLASGKLVECVVFLNPSDAPPEPALPAARYLSILAEGAALHGVDAAHVEALRAQPSIARKPPYEFEAFQLPEEQEQQKLTMEQLEAGCALPPLVARAPRGRGSCGDVLRGGDGRCGGRGRLQEGNGSYRRVTAATGGRGSRAWRVVASSLATLAA
eukprot:991074-Prymnesium_polylepis.1